VKENSTLGTTHTSHATQAITTASECRRIQASIQGQLVNQREQKVWLSRIRNDVLNYQNSLDTGTLTGEARAMLRGQLFQSESQERNLLDNFQKYAEGVAAEAKSVVESLDAGSRERCEGEVGAAMGEIEEKRWGLMLQIWEGAVRRKWEIEDQVAGQQT
jgi:hypothetical protein